jgi:hypothetical protein
MADDIKKRDNRDAEESGRPVQLDREQDDKMEHDKVKKDDKPAGEQAPKPGPQHQNR